MSIRANSMLAIALLMTAALLASAATILHRPDGSQQEGRLIVHEWGTFTSLSNAQGQAQNWSPLEGASELPCFVYRAQQGKQNRWLVRMETPVLYFYADREIDVSVDVKFPSGRITEWYPRSFTANPGISWYDLKVLSQATAKFPHDRSRSHYYPARETDAAPIRIGDNQRAEYEKFLFYRGVGNFALPLEVKLMGDQVSVRNGGRAEVAQVILFENRGGRAGWRIHSSLNSELKMSRPTLGQSIEALHVEVEKILVSQGLYKKEARAMVKTWSDSWFEEGLRAIYIVPRQLTDEILPISIAPAPAQLERVFVGRLEIITPEMEMAIQTAVQQFRVGSPQDQGAAINTIRRYGRFAEPVLSEMMRRATYNRSESAFWKRMSAAINGSTG